MPPFKHFLENPVQYSFVAGCRSAGNGLMQLAVCGVLVILVLLSGTTAKAQLLDYGTFAGYGIKKGILGNDYTTPLAACISGTVSTLPASRSAVRVSIVDNANEYKQAFHIDQKAEASFLGIGGGGEEFHFGQENTGRSSAFDIIIEAYGEHNGQTVDNIKWDAPYDSFMASGDPVKVQQARQDCGDRYIQTVFYETRLFVVLHVSNRQMSTLSTFSGKLGGNFNLDVASASVSLGGDGNVSSANKSGAIGLDVYTEGLGGVVPTAAVIGIATPSDDGLQSIANKLAAYLATLHDTGQPVKYRLAPLPGMSGGDLSDDRVFNYLTGMKMNHQATSYRLGNVSSLLSPSDPRRMILREPKADEILQQLKNGLTTYDNAVVKAHDGCRKALKLDTCAALTASIQAPPSRPSVELAPANMPLIGPYMFAIDGTPVPPGQVSVLFPGQAKNLLDAARALNPMASNVDILAPIYGDPYLSMVETTAMVFPPPTILQPGVGVYRLLGQTLRWPPYWKTEDRDNLSLWVVHADAQHPCNIIKNTDLYSFDQDCLTSEGRLLRDMALADSALYVTNKPPAKYDFTIIGTTTNCFGQTSTIPLGLLHFDVGSSMSSTASLLLPMGTMSIALVSQGETHDAQTWSQILQNRLSAAASSGGNPSGNPCGPRVP